MKVLIAEDEAPARERLHQLIEQIEGYEVVGEASNGRDALLKTADLQPDVLLLDIRMPGMDGMEAARHLAQLDNPPAVIFTTAYGEHALEAFETHAVDYLLKPIRKERLEQALAAAHKLTRVQLSSLQTEDEKSQGSRTHICARLRGELLLVPIEEIYFFQADQKYVTVRHKHGEVLIEESLKTLEDEFGEQFTRIHRNALVANAYLAGLEKDEAGHYLIRLRGIDDKLEISRRHTSAVKKLVKRLSVH